MGWILNYKDKERACEMKKKPRRLKLMLIPENTGFYRLQTAGRFGCFAPEDPRYIRLTQKLALQANFYVRLIQNFNFAR